jgi:hypothetical protein
MADDTTGGATGQAPATTADDDPYPIKVRGPDGMLHPFPEGTTAEQINAAMNSRYTPAGLPEAGAATPQSGAVMPFNRSVPGYLTNEDWQNIIASTILGKGNRGVVTAIQGTPGHQYRVELAKKVADETARRQDAQYAGTQILRSYAQLLDRFQNTPDEALKGAIGPRNTKPYKEWVPFVGGMTEPEAATAYSLMPNMTGSKSAPEAWNAQNLFSHDVHGVVNSLATNAGKGLNMSDARQAMFESTMRDFMRATDRQSAAEILEHAKHIIANDFGLPIGTANAIIGQYLRDIGRERSASAATAPGAAPLPTSAGKPYQERLLNKSTGQYETLQWNGKAWSKVQ